MVQEGTITRVVIDKGFGFIAVPGEDDRFFHVSALADGLAWDEQLTGRRVRFDLVDNYKGPKAVNIRAAD